MRADLVGYQPLTGTAKFRLFISLEGPPFPTALASHSTLPACRVYALQQTEIMPTCKSCGDEADELIAVKVAGKTKKLCEACADEVREQGEVAEASEAIVQNMMGFKGRR